MRGSEGWGQVTGLELMPAASCPQSCAVLPPDCCCAQPCPALAWFCPALPFPAGAGYHLFAGKEVARALAKVAVDEKECSDK
jgi:hypothetical protein